MEIKKHAVKIIGAVVVIFVVAFFFYSKNVDFLDKTMNESALPTDINLLSSKDAYGIAYDRAKKWKEDAALARITSSAGETGVSGRADDWELLFTSVSAQGKALKIAITDRTISSAVEIPYAAAGAALPDNIISSQEAVARAHSIKGYENEPVISVEMIYGPDGKQWYWGVKTAKGTVTINAKR